MSTIIPVDEASRVAEVRRTSLAVTAAEGLNPDLQAKAALAATELATNLLKYGMRGEVHITPLSRRGGCGIEMLSIDHGPGIEDLERSLADGYSTSGTAGTGLGAIVRSSTEFDAYSEPGKGTVVLTQIAPTSPQRSPEQVIVGSVSRPIAGEEVCGDAWAIRHEGPELLVMVADGLGHGMLAADASSAAVVAFVHSPETSPLALLERIHAALRGTRGAAVAIASINFNRAKVIYTGIGNIAGIIVSAAKHKYMVSHNGTAGQEARRTQEFSYDVPEASAVVMHSDGLTTSWNLDTHPGLSRHHPSVIAGVLYRDASRGRDDVCVVVIKNRAA